MAKMTSFPLWCENKYKFMEKKSLRKKKIALGILNPISIPF